MVGGCSTVTTVGSFAETAAITAACVAVGVDMPMWLPAEGVRAADTELRSTLLKGRTSTLFWTPTTAVLGHPGDHAAAVIANKAAGGKGPSAQGFALMAKVAEVRAVVRGESPRRHYEVHPESSFSAMHDDVPLAPKKTAAGVGQRIEQLLPHFPDLLDRLADAPARVPADDVLDAYACAWTASRIAGDTCRWFGPPTEDDGFWCAVAV